MCDECRAAQGHAAVSRETSANPCAAHVQESYDFAKDDDEAITNLWEAIRDMECECKGDHLKAFGLLVKEADRG